MNDNNDVQIKTDLESVKQYIDNGIDVNADIPLSVLNIKTPNTGVKKSIVKLCIENGSIDSLEYLIENGCKTNFLIRYAVKSQQFGVLQFLINKHLDVNEYNDNYSPALFAAVNANLYEYVKLLLEKGADPSIHHRGQTILSYAAKIDQLPIFRLLLKYGAPISSSQKSTTPLISALKAQNMEAVSLLLFNGADPNCLQQAKNNQNIYPLDIALRNKSSTATILLVLAGADVNHISNIQEYDPKLVNQINQYSDSNIIQASSSPLLTELKSLIQQFEIIQSNNQNLINYLQESEGNAKQEITPLLNQIREQFRKFADYVPLLINFENRLLEVRKPLLKQQMNMFEHQDRLLLAPNISDDMRKWHEFFPRTIELLKKNKTDSIQRNIFIDYCITQITKYTESLKDEEAQMLDFGHEHAAPDEKAQIKMAKRNRYILAEYAEILAQLKDHMAVVEDSIDNLEDESLFLLDSSIERIQSAEDKLTKLATANAKLARTGLSPQMIQDLQDSFLPKKSIIDESYKQLIDNKKSILEIAELMKRLLRRHYK